MINIKDKTDCCGCGACKFACPFNCIEMASDEEGFPYPFINTTKCIDCGICNKVCPMLGDDENLYQSCDNIFAGFSTDSKRLLSSSGGIFFKVAQYVINSGGAVYGVKMNENFKVAEYCRVDALNDLGSLLGSKYIEATDNGVFVNIKKDLESNIKVLFSGTPCKVFGLKKFLKIDYDNLLCIDIVCHGVPSSLIWQKHLDYIKKKSRKNLCDISFRCKKNGWNNFCMKYDFDDRTSFVDKWSDFYMLMFLKNMDLRPSCYSCNFKGRSTADITLGDYWGIETVLPNLSDDKGISAILIRTIKGEALIKGISERDDIKLTRSNFDDFISYNTAAINSSSKPLERETFFKDLNSIGYKKTVRKYIFKGPIGLLKMFLVEIGIWQYIKQIKSKLKND